MGDTNEAQHSVDRRQMWDILCSLWADWEFRKCLAHTPGIRGICRVEGQTKVSCEGRLGAQSDWLKELPALGGIGRELGDIDATAAAGLKSETEGGEEEVLDGNAF